MFFAMLVGPSKVRMYSQDKELEFTGEKELICTRQLPTD